MPEKNKNLRPAIASTLAAVALFATGTEALAQASVPLNQLPRPRDEPLPELPAPLPKPEIVVPPTPRPAEPPALSRGVTVVPRAFRFEGNTVISDSELQEIAAPYLGREIDSSALEELRIAITRRYVEAGYVNSGAVIPDQDVADGVITLRVVEGRLSEIIVGGAHGFRPDWLRDRIALGAGPPLNVNQLQERMQVMLQDPQIERMEAQLAPGVERGDAVLRVDVVEAKRYIVGLGASNNRSPSVGANEAEGFFSVRNLFGRGETFTIRGAFTEGVDDFYGVFVTPLNARGTLLALRYINTRSSIVERPLDQLDISARSQSYEAAVTHPLVETPYGVLNAGATLANRTTANYFLGQPSQFIPGAPDGRTTVSVLRLGLEGVARSTEQVFAGRVQVSNGLSAFGATDVSDPDVPDSLFTALLAQAQWVRVVIPGTSQLVVRADTQLTDRPLLGSEKYSLGGLDSVRGYRKDALVRDQGWFGSIEYRHLVGRLALRAQAAPGEGAVRLAAFFDTGQAWNKDPPFASKSTLSAVGAGMRWELTPNVEFQIYYGYALNDLVTPTKTLADKGVLFRLTAVHPF